MKRMSINNNRRIRCIALYSGAKVVDSRQLTLSLRLCSGSVSALLNNSTLSGNKSARFTNFGDCILSGFSRNVSPNDNLPDCFALAKTRPPGNEVLAKSTLGRKTVTRDSESGSGSSPNSKKTSTA